MIRMYNSFRLDDKNVVPFYDENEGFLSKAAAGTLPPVVFIEPQITGIPPLAQCSDDHPPANLSMGQLFINEVYNALVNSPQWRSCLLVITYDEHGGFFDHVPPPGTVMGPADWREKVPEIITDGPSIWGRGFRPSSYHRSFTLARHPIRSLITHRSLKRSGEAPESSYAESIQLVR